jgi:hypothetical protein
MARLLSEVTLVVSGDTGAVHIAAAVGTPVVGLYAATAYFAETAPWGAGHLILQGPAGTDAARFAPVLVLGAVLNRLGLVEETALRRQLIEHGVGGWETFFLPREADPLGGLSYRPLHETRIGLEELLTRSFRHVLARTFLGQEREVSLDYVRHWGGSYQWPGSAELEQQARHVRPGLVAAVELLERMAPVAAKGQELCGKTKLPSAATMGAITQMLVQKMEELKIFAVGKTVLYPVVHYLDWKLRMMPMLAPEATFAHHEHEYRRTASLLREAAGLVERFLKGADTRAGRAGLA